MFSVHKYKSFCSQDSISLLFTHRWYNSSVMRKHLQHSHNQTRNHNHDDGSSWGSMWYSIRHSNS